ncbi:unnamed protein product [Ectocarpus sp. 8 AP-2014]
MIRARHERSSERSTPPEIELLEAGGLKMNFVRTVIAVVEIKEEDLFRHIITYL